MLQISDMDGAILLTFSEPLSVQEKKLLSEARRVDAENAQLSDSPVGAGGIRWGACAKNAKEKPKDTPTQQQAMLAAAEQEMNDMNKAIQNAQTPEEVEQIMQEFGYETLYDPSTDDGIPF